MAFATKAPTCRSGYRVTVVGGGMAASRLVRQLTAHHCRFGSEAVPAGAAALDVTVIGEEPHAPYNRVLLADVLAGRYAPEVLVLPEPPATVHWLRGIRAVRLDRAAREVVCDDGQRVPYHRLVLATGSNPVLPPLRGLFGPQGGDLPQGVHAFRTMSDCLALTGAAGPGTRVVVIGGGLLGVSAARAMARRGAQVVLAHQDEYLMERQLDADAAGLLRQYLEALGVEVHTRCRVRGLVTSGRNESCLPASTSSVRAVAAVELADGFRLDAELVVLACGVRPRVGLARAAGLEVAQGIVVDGELRTSDPRIHAIGDCAEHDGVVYGLAEPAQDQADVLAGILARAARRPAGGNRTVALFEEPAASAPRYTGTRALTRLTLAAHATAGVAKPAPAVGPPAQSAVRTTTHPSPAPGTTACPTANSRTAGSPPPTSPTSGSTTNPTPVEPPLGPLDVAAFGEVHPAPGDDVVHLSDATCGAYRKVVVRGGRLVGGILLGDLGTVGALARTWEGDEPLPSAPLLHLLTDDGGF
jgi:assimilatory nitrate reductase electron transfer subunit